jgi:hypothetical protein
MDLLTCGPSGRSGGLHWSGASPSDRWQRRAAKGGGGARCDTREERRSCSSSGGAHNGTTTLVPTMTLHFQLQQANNRALTALLLNVCFDCRRTSVAACCSLRSSQ